MWSPLEDGKDPQTHRQSLCPVLAAASSRLAWAPNARLDAEECAAILAITSPPRHGDGGEQQRIHCSHRPPLLGDKLFSSGEVQVMNFAILLKY